MHKEYSDQGALGGKRHGGGYVTDGKSFDDEVYMPRHPSWYGRWLLPREVDLSRWPFMPSVLHQGTLGSCCAHAATNAYRFALEKEARLPKGFMPRWGRAAARRGRRSSAPRAPQGAVPGSKRNWASSCSCPTQRLQPHVHLVLRQAGQRLPRHEQLWLLHPLRLQDGAAARRVPGERVPVRARVPAVLPQPG